MSFYDKKCRICLQDGAIFPIFDNFEQDIQSKISICLHITVEDVEGYPRQICNKCNETLDVLCNFISKFKESCKALENGLLVLKDTNSYNPNYDLGINEIKEYLHHKNLNAMQTSPKTTQSKVKKKESKKKKLLPKNEIIEGKRNDRQVASSIFEGDFSLSGEEWCSKTNKTDTTVECRKKKLNKILKINNAILKEKKSPPPKLCDLCGEIFDQDKLQLHKKRVHFNNPAKCSVCSRICSSEYYLQRHMKRRHESNKKFPCTACDKSFAFVGELRSHNKYVHEKVLKPKKIFACKMCDKTYKCVQSLVIHERSAHTGERPAICSVCGISFYHEIYLREHTRLHTGETPFKCPVCGRGFAQNSNMKSHLRSHRKSELDPTRLSQIKPIYLKILKA